MRNMLYAVRHFDVSMGKLAVAPLPFTDASFVCDLITVQR
jgi:hypothetical protein